MTTLIATCPKCHNNYLDQLNLESLEDNAMCLGCEAELCNEEELDDVSEGDAMGDEYGA